jgi:hypothetical protein
VPIPTLLPLYTNPASAPNAPALLYCIWVVEPAGKEEIEDVASNVNLPVFLS